MADGVLDRLRRRDPGLAALRKAARVTAAAGAAFLGGRFLVGDTTFALYAVFGALALGVLSDVTGPPALRTRLLLGSLPVGLALVALGTALAGNVWAAAAGMLVVAFLVAYSSVFGPRIAGVANGLHLSYILACFPPYEPATLPLRLVGLGAGILLLTVADRVLWPAGARRGFPDRLATAADALVEQVGAVRAGGSPPRAELRLGDVPPAERPVGPGLRDRSLTVAASALQAVSARLAGLAGLPGGPLRDPVTALLAAVEDAVRSVPAALRGSGPPPDPEPVGTALARLLALRAAAIAADADAVARRDLRRGTATVMVAESTITLLVAVRAATGGSVPDGVRRGTIGPATFAYLQLTPVQRWWRRMRTHLDVHSVHFQNAARLALGLAVARVVADLPAVSHGFWVLLATLTLMRTSLVASRAALGPAFAGVVVGAVVAGLLVTVVGVHTGFYVWALLPVMLLGLVAGPLLGPAAGQAGFTVLVTVLFAQIAPTTWRLAETRLLDVVLGGVVGAVIGAAVWPRGGAGELRRSAAAVLRAGADDLVGTVRVLVAAPGALPPSPTRRLLVLLDATHAQYRTEPGSTNRTDRTDRTDWLTVLGVAHRLADESDLLRGRHPPAAPVPWPGVVDALEALADDVAAGLGRLAAGLDGGRTAPGPAPDPGAHPPDAPYSSAPGDALRVIDAWGWLFALTGDLARLAAALAPATGSEAVRRPAPNLE